MNPLIRSIVDRINTATYEGTTLSFTDVESDEDNPDEYEIDLRIVLVGDNILVAIDGVLLIADEDLVVRYILRNCNGGL